jgi:multisubunit Na+/H+ antiporter MnhE subunit
MHAAAELALWWLALTAGYLLLITSPSGIEVPVGLVIGALAATAAVAARHAFDPPTTVPAFVRRVVALPLDVAADALSLGRLLVTGRAFRGDVGTVDEIDLVGDDDAVRAWAVLLTSAAPGSVAADVEERDGGLVLRRHRLTGHDRTTAALGHR